MNAFEHDGGGSFPPYRVLNVEVDRALEASGHRHVIAVETEDPDGAQTRWTHVEVIAAIRDGERFVLPADQEEKELQPAICPGCRQATLVTVGGATATV